jgi:hypothetical protein
MTTDDTVETLRQKLTSEKPVLAAEASEPLTIVETEESDPKSETKSELRVTATTDLQAAQKADKDVEKVPASNLRRKLNAISILVVHDLL